MSKTFDPSSYQPLQPFFNLKMGGLDKIYMGPNVPVRMSYVTDLEGGSRCEFNLFDEAGWEVEPYIWQKRDPSTTVSGSNMPGGTFRFGWADTPAISNDIPFEIDSYTPALHNNAFTISINTALILGPTLSNNQYNGTVKDVIQKWADMYKLQVKYSPDVDESQMMDKGCDSHFTPPTLKRVVKTQDQCDWAFLIDICPYLVSQDGKRGYRPLITSDNSGQKTLNLSLVQNQTSNYDFFVNGTDSGLVLSWNPNVNFAMGAIDGQDTQHNAIQAGTGATMKVNMEQSVTQPMQAGMFDYNAYQAVEATKASGGGKGTQLIYVNAENHPKAVTGGNIRARTSGCMSSLGGTSVPLNQHLLSWLAGQTADITVMGDPRIVVMIPGKGQAIANVHFYYPQNYLNTDIRQEHYTSGKYMVQGVTHLIEEGLFTTTLHLERAAMPAYPTVQDTSGGA
jgi:hypothetical protein